MRIDRVCEHAERTTGDQFIHDHDPGQWKEKTRNALQVKSEQAHTIGRDIAWYEDKDAAIQSSETSLLSDSVQRFRALCILHHGYHATTLTPTSSAETRRI